MRKHLRECRSLCEEHGLNVQSVKHRGKHLAVVCDEGTVFFACTPSDQRWRLNARPHIRRMAAAN